MEQFRHLITRPPRQAREHLAWFLYFLRNAPPHVMHIAGGEFFPDLAPEYLHAVEQNRLLTSPQKVTPHTEHDFSHLPLSRRADNTVRSWTARHSSQRCRCFPRPGRGVIKTPQSRHVGGLRDRCFAAARQHFREQYFRGFVPVRSGFGPRQCSHRLASLPSSPASPRTAR